MSKLSSGDVGYEDGGSEDSGSGGVVAEWLR